MIKAFSVLAALALCWSSAVAQTTPATAPAPDAAPAAVMPGIQGQNISDVKPDASEEPGYANQTNGERARVQPGNNAPMWRQVNSGVAGYSSLPKSEAPEAGVLIQPFVQYPGSRLTNAGEAWRQVRNNWLIPYGGSLLLIVLGAIALFHFKIGPIKVKEELTGRVIERFSAFERSAHWANVAAFLVLAVSGVVMAFGKFFLLPIMGTTLFGWLSYVLKNAHNFAGPLFAVSLLVVIVTFMRDNLPAKGDLAWLLKGGGIFSGHEIDSGRYNAGEKVVFWGGVFFLGITVVVSGLAMDKLLPGLSYDRSTMQIAHMIHSVSNLLMLVMMMGHIYLGTLGTKGAYQGMRTGYVDETWAEQHHKLWFDDIKAGRIPAQRTPSATPAAQSGKVVQV
ncbi:formate dehydrogenase subunit gamma [Rhodoferax sp.]|jgi:formate dehydrogenase subunit gamma|uniref:formate dehydrogenase subunit gamma n=1 Tax=Rhodoferax sp. TaxID=50421 RepID=UPI00273617B5|nr:formate dehydrogenase subunit gamma [Rhodoferax sp.]MDP3189910.1 formate dehydrogenase subunit gamma [Rhodoferax sp.]MDP3337899.1 formate dehydrogenase subunit gamma [Rhodoferax sp.]